MSTDGSDDIERQWAKNLFNRVWELMERSERSEADDGEMIHAAHASCLHWLHVGEPVNWVRGEWLCSRVYAVLGRAEPARHHAERALALCRDHSIGDFDLAFAYESLARAAAVAGDAGESAQWRARAEAAAVDIVEADDRDLLLADLGTIAPAGT